eukprot:g2381.t1
MERDKLIAKLKLEIAQLKLANLEEEAESEVNDIGESTPSESLIIAPSTNETVVKESPSVIPEGVKISSPKTNKKTKGQKEVPEKKKLADSRDTPKLIVENVQPASSSKENDTLQSVNNNNLADVAEKKILVDDHESTLEQQQSEPKAIDQSRTIEQLESRRKSEKSSTNPSNTVEKQSLPRKKKGEKISHHNNTQSSPGKKNLEKKVPSTTLDVSQFPENQTQYQTRSSSKGSVNLPRLPSYIPNNVAKKVSININTKARPGTESFDELAEKDELRDMTSMTFVKRKEAPRGAADFRNGADDFRKDRVTALRGGDSEEARIVTQSTISLVLQENQQKNGGIFFESLLLFVVFFLTGCLIFCCAWIRRRRRFQKKRKAGNLNNGSDSNNKGNGEKGKLSATHLNNNLIKRRAKESSVAVVSAGSSGTTNNVIRGGSTVISSSGASPVISNQSHRKTVALSSSIQSPHRSGLSELNASGGGSLLSDAKLKELVKHLPQRLRIRDWRLLYSSEVHGYSLASLYQRAQQQNCPSILIASDENGSVFGAFSSDTLKKHKGFFGSGESFVFTILPWFNVFKWTGENSQFVLARDDCIAFGGRGFALWFDSMFESGASSKSTTYNNEVLASSEEFKVVSVEVWAI